MPISHERKYIFIHVPKTAGDAIEKTLGLQKDNELYGFEDLEGKVAWERPKTTFRW